jgi:hypothetical protein
MKRKCIDIYVFEDARLDGAKDNNVRETVKPEINMAAVISKCIWKEIIAQVG